jgi:L-lactate dehydrogenase complex protein LldF
VEVRSRDYRERARHIIEDTPDVREAVTAATITFVENRSKAFADLDAEALSRWAEQVKSHALTHLGDYLEEAEARLVERGVHVHWAETASDVHQIFKSIVRENDVQKVVKAKSMLSEELALNPFLESCGVEVFETDLGEYIIQLLGEPPSHIVGPSIHKSLEDTRVLFHA